MSRELNLMMLYGRADSSKRIDLIMGNYMDFMTKVNSYTCGLKRLIISDIECKNREEIGDLGVRIQSGGMHSDPTQKAAIQNIEIADVIVNCDFSSCIFEELDRADEYKRQALILRDMREDYQLFNDLLPFVGKNQKYFVPYLSGEVDLNDLAEEIGITYDSANKKIKRARKIMKEKMQAYLDGNVEEIA